MTRDDIIRMAREAGLFQHVPPTSHVSFIYDLMEFTALVAAHEREACERLVWDTPEPDDEYVSHREAIAAAIRARGNDETR